MDGVFGLKRFSKTKIPNTCAVWGILFSNKTQLFNFASALGFAVFGRIVPRISFACPYCGDSHLDARKKRGNLFADTMRYYCFNGDCGANMSILNFLKDKHQIQKFSEAEISYLRETSKNSKVNLSGVKSTVGLETYFSDEIERLSVDRDELIKTLKLQEIKGSRIEGYLRKRLQTNFKRFAYDPKERNVYVFYLTKDDRIVGLQIKTFKKRNPYLTYKLTNIHEMLGILKDENLESLERMDFLSNIFNIFLIDLSKPVTAFEGPLDSFLFPNAVGLCSAKNSLPFDIQGSRYFYDNDNTGKDYSIRRISEGSQVFLWKKYLTENELLTVSHKIKDLNDLILYIKQHREKKFTPLKSAFSEDKYDMIWI